jgi:hypothetical protein
VEGVGEGGQGDGAVVGVRIMICYAPLMLSAQAVASCVEGSCACYAQDVSLDGTAHLAVMHGHCKLYRRLRSLKSRTDLKIASGQNVRRLCLVLRFIHLSICYKAGLVPARLAEYLLPPAPPTAQYRTYGGPSRSSSRTVVVGAGRLARRKCPSVVCGR